MESTLHAANEEARARLLSALEGKGAHLSFERATSDFPADLRNVKPPHVPYTFWHQLEHVRIGQWDILRYIVDPSHESPPWPQGYWPAFDSEADDAAWEGTIRRFQADRESLISLARDPECRLFEPVAHMDGHSIMRELLLVIDHTAYHLGEFVMARQISGAWKSELD